jgi:hypothetical protein
MIVYCIFSLSLLQLKTLYKTLFLPNEMAEPPVITQKKCVKGDEEMCE